MATSAQGTILKFTPSGGEQVTVGRLTSVGEIAPEAEAVDVFEPAHGFPMSSAATIPTSTCPPRRARFTVVPLPTRLLMIRWLSWGS